jgi:hypothetical protein
MENITERPGGSPNWAGGVVRYALTPNPRPRAPRPPGADVGRILTGDASGGRWGPCTDSPAIRIIERCAGKLRLRRSAPAGRVALRSAKGGVLSRSERRPSCSWGRARGDELKFSAQRSASLGVTGHDGLRPASDRSTAAWCRRPAVIPVGSGARTRLQKSVVGSGTTQSPAAGRCPGRDSVLSRSL